jgi:hypothetical protein
MAYAQNACRVLRYSLPVSKNDKSLIRRGESVVVSARTDWRRIHQDSSTAPRRGRRRHIATGGMGVSAPIIIHRNFLLRGWGAHKLFSLMEGGYPLPKTKEAGGMPDTPLLKNENCVLLHAPRPAR